MKGEVVIRPPAWARISVLGFSIFWSAFFVQAAVRSPGSQIFGPILIGALGLLFTIRTVDEKIVANEGGVFIRNSLRTWRLRWAEVQGFEVGRLAIRYWKTIVEYPARFGREIHVILRNGEVVPVEASMRLWRSTGSKTKTDRMLADLRAHLPTSPRGTESTAQD
jgi:hypothetical protein